MRHSDDRKTLSSSRAITASQTTRLSSTRSNNDEDDDATTTTSINNNNEDQEYMQQAIECAKQGLGHTFPNPAVGCVIVQDGGGGVIGRGFHPRAGFPHAEVFALLEAAGHVPDGVQAARTVIRHFNQQNDNEKRNVEEEEAPSIETIQDLSDLYATPNGPAELFGSLFAAENDETATTTTTTTTAYVTLEPCCHHGQTPPCAASLALSQVDRVVVGFRDPNPRVDGGGVKLLETAGVQVDFATPATTAACHQIVTDFCKRITPRELDYDELVTGGMRRALRSFAERGKADGSLAEVSWGGGGGNSGDGGSFVDMDSVDDIDSTSFEEAIDQLDLKPEWMEHVDGVLWQKELVLLRLNQAVRKKKGAKLLGQRIAQQLQAHVAQTKGHTVLLYRPAIPPVLDLEALVEARRSNSAAE